MGGRGGVWVGGGGGGGGGWLLTHSSLLFISPIERIGVLSIICTVLRALCVHSNLSKEHHFSAIVPCWRSKGDSVYRSHESLCTLWLHWLSSFRGIYTKSDVFCSKGEHRHSKEILISFEMKCWHTLKNWLLVFNILKVFLKVNFSGIESCANF